MSYRDSHGISASDPPSPSELADDVPEAPMPPLDPATRYAKAHMHNTPPRKPHVVTPQAAYLEYLKSDPVWRTLKELAAVAGVSESTARRKLDGLWAQCLIDKRTSPVTAYRYDDSTPPLTKQPPTPSEQHGQDVHAAINTRDDEDPLVRLIARLRNDTAPYDYTVSAIACLLEVALGTIVGGRMSQGEYENLMQVAITLQARDKGVVVRPEVQD